MLGGPHFCTNCPIELGEPASPKSLLQLLRLSALPDGETWLIGESKQMEDVGDGLAGPTFTAEASCHVHAFKTHSLDLCGKTELGFHRLHQCTAPVYIIRHEACSGSLRDTKSYNWDVGVSIVMAEIQNVDPAVRGQAWRPGVTEANKNHPLCSRTAT